MIATKRNGVYYPQDYPDLFRELASLMEKNTVLDGELVKLTATPTFYVFDVLYDNGTDVRRWTLIRRKLLLEGIIRPEGNVRMVESKFCDNEAQVLRFYDAVVEKGAEGVVVKDAYSSYGDPESWLKKRATDTIDCVVQSLEKSNDTQLTGRVWTYGVGLLDKNRRVAWTGRVSSATNDVDRSMIKVGTILEVRFNTFQGQIQFPGTIVRIRSDISDEDCSVDQLEG